MNSEALNQFIEHIENHSAIAICAPASPDGDSIGTQCALLEAFELKYPNKNFTILSEEPLQKCYQHLALSSRLELSKDYIAKQPNKSNWPSLMIVVDGGWTRMGDSTTQLWKNATNTLQIDHHMSAQNGVTDYDHVLFDPHAASTTILADKLIAHLDIPLNKSVAEALYIGLIYDTGMFKHSNTTPETHLLAAKLLKTGFNHTECAEKTLMIRSPAALKLQKKLLEKMNTNKNNKTVFACINLEDFKSTQATADDKDGLINILFLTDPCQVAYLAVETKKDLWKVSFRSRGPDVSLLAKKLSEHGGGHKLASGCTLIDFNEESVIKHINTQLDQHLSL